MSRYATDFPALVPGGVVTQGHADYCERNGHAAYVDGVEQERCPRCGDVRGPGPLAEAWAHWRARTDSEEGSAEHDGAARELASRDLSETGAAFALKLGAELWKGSSSEWVSEVAAVAVAAAFVDDLEVWSDDPEDAARELDQRVTGLFSSSREAAFAAVRQLRTGEGIPGLDDWKEQALAASDCPDAVIREVRLIVQSERPGLDWKTVPGLGVLLFRLS